MTAGVLVAEARQAARSLARAPQFALVAFVTLALALAAATAVFTVLKQTVLDALPYPDAERLVMLRTALTAFGPDSEWQVGKHQYFHLRDNARTLTDIGLYGTVPLTVETEGGPRRTAVTVAGAAMHRLLGVNAALGRTLQDADDDPDAPVVAFLSHRFWQETYGGAPDVVGRTLRVNDQVGALGARGASNYPIAGVLDPAPALPSGFRGRTERTEVWLSHPQVPDQWGHSWGAIAKRRTGESLALMQAELDTLSANLPDAFPEMYERAFLERAGFRTAATPLKEFVTGPISQNLWTVQAAVVVLLLMAWFNVANLTLVRAETRHREMAVRGAVGAGRPAIFRLMLVESGLVALASGAAGLIASVWIARTLVALSPVPLPRLDEVSLDIGVGAFAAAGSVLAATVLAAIPAWRIRLSGPVEAGRGATEGREQRRVTGGLVVAQLAMATMLVVAACLLLTSFLRLRDADPGFQADGVLRVRVDADGPVWPLVREAMGRLGALPGVTAVGAASTLPLTGFPGHDHCASPAFEDPSPYERIDAAGLSRCSTPIVAAAGHFRTLGIPVLRGRAFEAGDADEAAEPVAVVSRAFAAHFWPNEDAIGKRLGVYGDRPPHRVVGVVGDVYAGSVDEPPAVAAYYPPLPHLVVRSRGLDVTVRFGPGDAAAAIPAVRQAVSQTDAAIFIERLEPMAAVLARAMGDATFALVLLCSAGAGALALAALGLYGVVAYLAARRTKEIGIRMALGGRAARIRKTIVAGSLRLVAIGLVLGLTGSLLGGRAIESLLFGVSPASPAILAAAAAVLALTALAASWLATRHATRVAPADALRQE